ncbi:MAG: thiamine pyrophosphate-binding protein [Alphaproteobacteria bacterium]|nr:MAG: thiamine pyrophosphate-binding protein [Alphaproteobacteria bacterium]
MDYRTTFSDLAKWVTEVDDPARLPEVVARAFSVALSGRPGPVVVALPEDMLREQAAAASAPKVAKVRNAPPPDAMADLAGRLASARRPLVIVGGSGWTDDGIAYLAAFAHAQGLPVACAFRRQDLFDNRHPHYVGDVGLGINPALKDRIARADLILAVGTRLGEIVTGGYQHLTPPVPDQTLVHVHADAAELGKVYTPALAIQADPNVFALSAAELPAADRARWADWLLAARADYEAWQQPVEPIGPVDLTTIVKWMSGTLPEDAIIANGAGNFTIWLHRFFQYKRPRTQIAPTSGAMGYGVPAAIAAKLACPDRLVVSWIGDGCFLMTGQELATAVRHKANVIFVVVNNGIYGTIRMHQERSYPGRVIATDLANPDFMALAQAYGAAAHRVTRTGEFAPAFEAAARADRPSLIEIVIPAEELSPTMKLQPQGK